MHSPFANLIDQMFSNWYWLGIVPVGFDPKKPVGTGPFKVESFTPGQQSVFVRNPNYWRSGLPYLDKVIITDIATRVL